jgi:methionine-rich copper-binding protein CopC
MGLAALAGAAPASAHDQLIASAPAADEVLTVRPAEVALTFSAPIMPIAPTILVRDAAGALLPGAEPTVVGAVVTAPISAELPDGAYTVVWRVVSQDGHPIEGPSTTAPTAAATLGSAGPAVTEPTTGLPLSPALRAVFAVATLGAAVTLTVRLVRRRSQP